MKKPHDIFGVPKPVHLNFDLHDTHLANALANLTLSWGRIEHQLFLIILFIDVDRGAEFAEAFFASTNVRDREKVLLKSISEAMKGSYPDFEKQLRARLKAFKSVRERRNILAHGLWTRKTSKSFSVIPLRFNKNTHELDKPISVNLKHVVNLCNDIHRLTQGFAGLALEMLAHQKLAKVRSKRLKQ